MVRSAFRCVEGIYYTLLFSVSPSNATANLLTSTLCMALENYPKDLQGTTVFFTFIPVLYILLCLTYKGLSVAMNTMLALL
jgi:hypothetical protein